MYVRISVETILDEYDMYLIREVVCDAIREARQERAGTVAIFDTPIDSHVFVSQIRQGSVEFLTLYHALLTLPWDQVTNEAVGIGRDVSAVVEQVGKFASGVMGVVNLGIFISSRLRQKTGLPHASERPAVVTPHSSLDVHPPQADDAIGRLIEQRLATILNDAAPRAVLVILDSTSINAIQRVLAPEIHGVTHHVGGSVLLHDFNLELNGLSSLDQLHPGDLFCLHNAPALGFTISEDESLFEALRGPFADLELVDVQMEHADFSDEPVPIVEGPTIDVDDLHS
jgi:hypothetical protein